MKPVLKPPGSILLKLIYDEPLSTFAFKFNLRRYNEGARTAFAAAHGLASVGRCWLTLSNLR